MQKFTNVDSMLAACVQPNGTQNSGIKIEPTNLPWPEENPSLTQQHAAATEMGGIAPEPSVQEARPSGQFDIRPSISMREFTDVDSMLAAHDAEHGNAPLSMQVFPPAAWRHHVPWCNGPSVPSASGSRPVAEYPDALNRALPVRKAVALAEYNLQSTNPFVFLVRQVLRSLSTE